MKVSIIMPIRNERLHIASTLDSLLAQDFTGGSLQIVCIDGMSDDGTRDILFAYARRHSCILMIDNPKRATATALNLGIRQSEGEFIIRVDAHSLYPRDYVSKLLENMRNLSAENVGGVCEVGSTVETAQAQAIRAVLTSRLGVGNSLFRVGVKKTMEADTVPFGCFRRSLFERIGYFDERLNRTEDYEFNQRIRKSGGRIFLVSDIRITYFPATHLAAFFRKQYSNGYGVMESGLVFGKTATFSLRHYTPLAFVLYVMTLPLLLLMHWTFLAPLALYGLLCIAVGVQQAIRSKNAGLVLFVPLALFGTHCSHGLGAIRSVLETPGKLRMRESPAK